MSMYLVFVRRNCWVEANGLKCVCWCNSWLLVTVHIWKRKKPRREREREWYRLLWLWQRCAMGSEREWELIDNGTERERERERERWYGMVYGIWYDMVWYGMVWGLGIVTVRVKREETKYQRKAKICLSTLGSLIVQWMNAARWYHQRDVWVIYINGKWCAMLLLTLKLLHACLTLERVKKIMATES